MNLSRKLKVLIISIFAIVFLIILYFVSETNYLFYHNFVEFFSIVIAFVIFTIAWNTREYNENNYLILLGSAYLFIGSLDFVHSLSYKGMSIFNFQTANVPIQLWISARYIEAFSLLIAPLLLGIKKIDIRKSIIGYSIITLFVFISIFYLDIFPTAYVQGKGLTTFKIASEYIISVLLIISAFLLYLKRDYFQKNILYMICGAIIFTIFAELSFTLYISVYGLSNFIGHAFKLASFYLVYRALVLTTMKQPTDVLYKELKHTKDELERIIEGMDDAVFLHDLEGNIIKTNKAAAEHLGYSKKEILEMKPTDFDRKDYSNEFGKRVNEIRENESTKFEVVHIAKDGKEIPVEINSTLLKYKEKDVVLSVARNISERVEAKEELQKSRKFLQKSIDSILANIVIIDEEGKILKVNERWKEFAENNGLSWDDYGIGHNYLEIVKNTEGPSTEGSDKVYNNLLKVINGEKNIFYHEYPCHSPDEKRWFLMNASRFKIDDKVRVIISHINITDRKKAELELRLKENVIEYSINAMAIGDEQGYLTYVNRSFLSMWGYDKKEEVIGKHASEFWESSMNIDRIIEKLNSLGIWTGELTASTRKGNQFTVQVLASTFKNEEDESKRMIASFVDITQRKRKEKELKQALQDLKESNRELKETQEKLSQANKMAAVGQLAGGVAHELNNPMTAVSIYSDMLLTDLKEQDFECTDDETLEKFKERMKTMNEAADRCKEITNNLLRFSRKSGEEFVSIDIKNVLDNTLSLLSKKLEDEDIEVEIDLDDDLPFIKGNSKQLQQVFTNIILNSEDAIEDEGIIKIKAERSKDDELVMKFEDNGEGIEKEDIDKIFEPFYTTKAPGEGTGLGLSISYRIIKDHDGDIEVESEKDKGTTFKISLPVESKGG